MAFFKAVSTWFASCCAVKTLARRRYGPACFDLSLSAAPRAGGPRRIACRSVKIHQLFESRQVSGARSNALTKACAPRPSCSVGGDHSVAHGVCGSRGSCVSTRRYAPTSRRGCLGRGTLRPAGAGPGPIAAAVAPTASARRRPCRSCPPEIEVGQEQDGVGIVGARVTAWLRMSAAFVMSPLAK